MIIGLLIFLFGFLFLLKNLGIVIFPAGTWDIIWSIIFIVIGFYLIGVSSRIRNYRSRLFGKYYHFKDKGKHFFTGKNEYKDNYSDENKEE